MTERWRQRAWNAAGWAGLGVGVVLAAAGFVALLVTWPIVTGVVTMLAASHGAAWWVPNRGLRADLEAARFRLSTYNGSETHEALAEVGPITGESPGVEPFMADSGYRRPFPAVLREPHPFDAGERID